MVGTQNCSVCGDILFVHGREMFLRARAKCDQIELAFCSISLFGRAISRSSGVRLIVSRSSYALHITSARLRSARPCWPFTVFAGLRWEGLRPEHWVRL